MWVGNMKVGDLVKHNPARSNHPTVKALYEDWGYASDFKSGIIVVIQGEFAMVVPSKNALNKPAWYQHEELEVISEG